MIKKIILGICVVLVAGLACLPLAFVTEFLIETTGDDQLTYRQALAITALLCPLVIYVLTLLTAGYKADYASLDD